MMNAHDDTTEVSFMYGLHQLTAVTYSSFLTSVQFFLTTCDFDGNRQIFMFEIFVTWHIFQSHQLTQGCAH